MDICAVKWEIPDKDGMVIAEFEIIDEESIEVNIERVVLTPNNLKELSKLLQKAYNYLDSIKK